MSKTYQSYEDRENNPPELATQVNIEKILQWMLVNDRIPTPKEVMDITGFGYDWSAALRRKALREYPRVDIEELGEEVKMLLLKRIKGEDIENVNLVRLMPWVASPKEAAVDVKQEITHKFVVVKPGDEEPAEKKAENN